MSTVVSKRGNFQFRFDFTRFLHSNWYRSQSCEGSAFSFDEHSIGPTGSVFGGHLLYAMIMSEIARKDSSHRSVVGFTFDCVLSRPVQQNEKYVVSRAEDSALYLQRLQKNFCRFECNHHAIQRDGRFASFGNLNLQSQRTFLFDTNDIRREAPNRSHLPLRSVDDCCESLYHMICYFDYEAWAQVSEILTSVNLVTFKLKGKILTELPSGGDDVFLEARIVSCEGGTIVTTVIMSVGQRPFLIADVTFANIDPVSRKRIPIEKPLLE